MAKRVREHLSRVSLKQSKLFYNIKESQIPPVNQVRQATTMPSLNEVMQRRIKTVCSMPTPIQEEPLSEQSSHQTEMLDHSKTSLTNQISSSQARLQSVHESLDIAEKESQRPLATPSESSDSVQSVKHSTARDNKMSHSSQSERLPVQAQSIRSLD